ncbi:MAG: diguanylate cyclase [Gallionella sp.]|nr:diguanylate cyclase [Gallionella sp.]
MRRKFQAGFHGFHIDSISGVQHKTAGEIKLQRKELAVLVELLLNAGTLVTKEQLIQAAWGGASTSDSSIARCISGIKSKLAAADEKAHKLFGTVYGKGYKFIGTLQHSSSNFLCEESFSILINASPDFVLFKDSAGRWLTANQAALKIFDLENVDWQGKTDSEIAELLPPAYRPILEYCTDSDEAAWQNRQPTRSFESLLMHNGGKHDFDVVKTPLFNDDGSRNLLIVFGHDITELLKAREQQRLSDEILANNSEAVMITDKENIIVSVNRAFTIITGYKEDEVIGLNPRIFSSERHDRQFFQALWEQLNTAGVWRGEIWDKKKNGEIYPKWLHISQVRNQQGELCNYIAIFSDLSEIRTMEEKYAYLAYHDALTQLPNRLLLQDRFKQSQANALRENKMLAVLFLDLDHFKSVNDNYGHGVGDLLLQTFARRLEASVRDADTVSRISGDEFVVLLPGLDSTATAALIAKKILSDLRKPFDLGMTNLSLTTSIGIAMFPQDAPDLEALLHMADTSMYHAKNNGGGNYKFFAEHRSAQDDSQTNSEQ